MRQTEFTRRVDKVLYDMAYDFHIEHCDATPEEAHKAGLEKIGQTYKMAEEETNQKWIDITTGKEVAYSGW